MCVSTSTTEFHIRSMTIVVLLLVTVTNLCVILFVIIVGSFNLNFENWSLSSERVREYEKNNSKEFDEGQLGEGGFFPYGITGIIKGAAICFYAFIGFDVIATAGEEAKNPKKSIPFSICLSLLIIFLAYFLSSSVLTLMLPYYEQDPESPLPHVFKEIGWTWAQYLVSFGAICGMLPSLYGAIYRKLIN
jgi:solute carrier family 7 (cationic amino acid transporter), member 2